MLSQVEREFLTTWLMEIGMKPVSFWAGKVEHPATYAKYYSMVGTHGTAIDELKQRGYIKNDDKYITVMLTQKALDELGGHSDSCPNVTDETDN